MSSSLPLPTFIRKNLEPITEEWREFAQSLAPAGTTDLELRDHIHKILFFIADDIESPQTNSQQHAKSRGYDDEGKSPAQIHAQLRHTTGFNLVGMISEYRALRASILKLWTKNRIVLIDSDVQDLIRFNEAIDQLLAQSVAAFIENYPSMIEKNNGLGASRNNIV